MPSLSPSTSKPTAKPTAKPTTETLPRPTPQVTLRPTSRPTVQPSKKCTQPDWAHVPNGCGTFGDMTYTQCEVLMRKWETGICHNTAPNPCPIPYPPVWWFPKSCPSHNGCMVFFDCYQLTCSTECNKMNSVGCAWQNNRCVYLPTGI